MRMFEVIFNIRLLDSQSVIAKSDNYESLLRKLIALIWLQKLADANRHGLPRTNATDTHTGSSVKGQINVKKTIQEYISHNHITSNVRHRTYDPIVTTILWQAYLILSKQYNIRQISHTDSALDAIQHLQRIAVLNQKVTLHQYRSIKYKVLYQSYKPVVDLSWQILANSMFSNEQKDKTKGFGLFLDVAELWESYLYTLFKRAYTPLGWNIEKPEVVAYPGKLFQRKLIPDIVLSKDDKYCVWDAKYKRMNFNPYDVDRSDFFQIHTYVQYFAANYQVISCGLIYPVNNEPTDYEKLVDNTLFGLGQIKTTFSIYTMNVNEYKAHNNIKETETDFTKTFYINLLMNNNI
ncbi:hypothetical protein BN8_03773 [Fibrisoma limi BUZ 3]|uniref:5-methylcytosine restriction system component-like protein n=2 Tax=Fibrisoma limi TaxID=663275 RepID=I2GL13_9BACT|nr:hypothetical protein BN8_03773 [Fibrisoma limi BUZ 3]